MRLLVVSHPAILPSNQSVYAALQDSGDEVHLVTPHAWRHEYAKDPVRPTPNPHFRNVRTLRVLRPGSIIGHMYLARLEAVLRDVKPDVLYVEEEPYALATMQWARAARRCGVSMFFYTAQNIPKHYPAVIRRGEAFVQATSEAICISEDARQALHARGFRGRTHIVPLSVDTNLFCPGPERASRGTVGYVGRLVPEKGLRVLLDAQRSSRVPFRLRIVGDGPMRAELAGSPAVDLVGTRSVAQMPDEYRKMDVVAVPSLTTASWREQFGRTVLEAAACGVPVVASDSGELPLLLTALAGPPVVREGDATALGDSLELLLSQDGARREYGRDMRRAVNSFSVAGVAAQLHEALSSSAKPGSTV